MKSASGTAALPCESQDDMQVTSKHLSGKGRKFCWNNTSIEYHKDCLGNLAINNPAERSFGGTTRQLKYYGRIGLTNSGGVNQVRRKEEFNRNVKTGSKISDNNRLGIPLYLSEEMRQSCLVLTREGLPSAR